MKDEFGYEYGHGIPCPLCKSKNTEYNSQVMWKGYEKEGKFIHVCQDCKWVFDERGNGRTI